MINISFVRQVGLGRWTTRYLKRQFTKRVLKRGNRMRLPTGSTILLSRKSHSATEVYVTKANMDWGSEALFAKYADRRRDFIDVGAHIGYYSVYLSPLVRRAYAFEPDPRNIADLQANADLAGNIEIVQMAVSSRSGTGQFDVGSDSAVSTLEVATGHTITIPMTSIDDFVARHPDIDPALIKTDAEGHDFQALSGMTQTIARYQPLILAECGLSPALSVLCADWRYLAFAITRDRATFKTQLRQLSSPEEALAYWWKMLFLVPAPLAASFLGHGR